MHPLHSLTPLTGREAAEKRTVVVGTVELNWRLFMVLASAAPVALLLAAITWPFLGQYAIFVFPIVMLGASFLFYRRTSNGMGLHTYQALLDKKRSNDVGKVYLCGYEVDTSTTNLLHVRHNTAPYRVDAAQIAPVVASQATATHTSRSGHRGPADGHAWNGGFEASDQALPVVPVRGGETRSLVSVGARTGASDALASMKGAGERVTGALRPRRRLIADPGSFEPVVEQQPFVAPSAPEPVAVQFVAPAAPAAPPVAPPARTEPVYAPPVHETAPAVVEPAPAAPVVEPPTYIASSPEVDAPRQAPYAPTPAAVESAPAPAPVTVVAPAPEPGHAPEPFATEGPEPTGDPATDFDAGVFFDQPTSRRKRGL